MTLATTLDHSKRAMFHGRDIPWLLNQWATRTPDKIFLAWEPFDTDPRTWTYAQFSSDVEAVAASLAGRGVNPGERVLIHLDNSPEFIISWFACARIGAVAVSTNTRSVMRDMTYFADHASVVAAITQPCFAELVYKAAPDIRFLAVTDNDAGKAAAIDSEVPHVPFNDLLEEKQPCPARASDAMANLGIQFTSGTTSRPKAVLWTHANAVWGAQVNTAHMRLQSDDVTICFLPLFHTNAQSYSMLATLWVGGTMVFQPRFSASRFWEVSLRHKITWASMIPFCFKALMTHETPEKHFYRFWGVGAHIPAIEEIFKVRILGWWGMTETITQGIVSDISHPGKHGSIGRASPAYDIQIRKPDGTPAEPGERGRLFIRGTRGVALFKEYFRNDDANAEAFDAEGWFDTGDLIMMDEDGDLFFSDRDKDMLKVGAENVAASEIESVINASGLVTECAVVGQKHFMLDEVPVVFVIPAPGAADNLKEKLIAHCVENLADFKVVRDVHIVDELPRSTLEKIAKNELRDRLPAIEQ
jgi:crotonobetaine/carnitine-CoA ligase